MSKFIEVTTPQQGYEQGLPLIAAGRVKSLPAVPAGFDALVYCDGACTGNGKENAPGGWGVALVKAGHPGATVGWGGAAGTTNNKMELTAAIEALSQMPAGSAIVLRTDSQYVIKGCTEWRAGWVRNGMKNSKKEPVANPEFWSKLWALVDARKVKFEWVKGHNGDNGNELADALAVLGASKN